MTVKLFTAKHEIVIHTTGRVEINVWFCCREDAEEFCRRYGCRNVDEFAVIKTDEVEYRSYVLDLRAVRKLKLYTEAGIIIIKP